MPTWLTTLEAFIFVAVGYNGLYAFYVRPTVFLMNTKSVPSVLQRAALQDFLFLSAWSKTQTFHTAAEGRGGGKNLWKQKLDFYLVIDAVSHKTVLTTI